MQVVVVVVVVVVVEAAVVVVVVVEEEAEEVVDLAPTCISAVVARWRRSCPRWHGEERIRGRRTRSRGAPSCV